MFVTARCMFIWAPCDAFGTALRGAFAVTVRDGFAAAFRGGFAAAFRGGFAAALRGAFAVTFRGGGGFTEALVLPPAEERKRRSTGEMFSGKLAKSSAILRKLHLYAAELLSNQSIFNRVTE